MLTVRMPFPLWQPETTAMPEEEQDGGMRCLGRDCCEHINCPARRGPRLPPTCRHYVFLQLIQGASQDPDDAKMMTEIREATQLDRDQIRIWGVRTTRAYHTRNYYRYRIILHIKSDNGQYLSFSQQQCLYRLVARYGPVLIAGGTTRVSNPRPNPRCMRIPCCQRFPIDRDKLSKLMTDVRDGEDGMIPLGAPSLNYTSFGDPMVPYEMEKENEQIWEPWFVPP